MEKFVPYEKMSKKQKRELDSKKRGTWGSNNPVTRAPEYSGAYDRNKEKEKVRNDSRGIFEF